MDEKSVTLQLELRLFSERFTIANISVDRVASRTLAGVAPVGVDALLLRRAKVGELKTLVDVRLTGRA